MIPVVSHGLGERQGDYNHLPPLLSSLFVRSLAEQLAIMRF